MSLTHLVPIDNWCIDYGWALSAWEKLELANVAIDWGDERETEMKYTVTNGVAVLDLTGPLTKDLYCGGVFGGTSTILARRALQKADRDSSVRSILLRISSPGGQVSGTNELASEVRRITKSGKRCVAYAEDLCASAAYWVGSQANEFYCNPTATVGSIGTYMVMYDTSKAYEARGVKVHVIGSGPMKGAGENGTAVTEAMLDRWRANILDINSHFVEAVQTGRKMTSDAAMALATGETWIGAKAKNVGLVDDVCAFDDVLRNMACGKNMKGENMAGETDLIGRIRSLLNANDATNDGDTSREVADSSDRELVRELKSMGIANVGQLRNMQELSKLGDEYLTATRQYAVQQAIRLYGAQQGTKIGARMLTAPFAEAKATAFAWETEADLKHGTGATAGRRASQSPYDVQDGGQGNTFGAAPAAASREQLLAMTPLGKKVLKQQKAGNN